MAIKVNGTTVVDDSRNLTNVASIDATTEAAISAAGFSQTTGDITAVTAGSGMTGGGTSGAVTISHADTSSRSSVNNSGNTVIQDIYLDTYGHVTAINSKTISTAAPSTYNAVGTYIFAIHRYKSTDPGSSYAASSLNFFRASGIGVDGTTPRTSLHSSSPSGTWRCMGHADNSNYFTHTLWLRIS